MASRGCAKIHCGSASFSFRVFHRAEDPTSRTTPLARGTPTESRSGTPAATVCDAIHSTCHTQNNE
eukprot:6181457-Pleurochrysis_carterae.AAC.1